MSPTLFSPIDSDHRFSPFPPFSAAERRYSLDPGSFIPAPTERSSPLPFSPVPSSHHTNRPFFDQHPEAIKIPSNASMPPQVQLPSKIKSEPNSFSDLSSMNSVVHEAMTLQIPPPDESYNIIRQVWQQHEAANNNSFPMFVNTMNQSSSSNATKKSKTKSSKKRSAAALTSPDSPDRKSSNGVEIKRWTKEEHIKFDEAVQLFGLKNWTEIATHIGTRSAAQVKTHARYLTKRKHAIEEEKEKQDIEDPISERVLDLESVTEEEKEFHREFFSGNTAKTPQRYLKIRNHIIDCWTQSRPAYVSKSYVRQGLKDCGDVNSIGKVHSYLERTGVINFGAERPNRIKQHPCNKKRAVGSTSPVTMGRPIGVNAIQAAAAAALASGLIGASVNSFNDMNDDFSF